MAATRKTKRQIEYGDFQTPPELAREVCELLARRGVRPASLIEPTCGTGNFLIAGLERFGEVKQAIGLEINPDYVKAATSATTVQPYLGKVRIIHDSFFEADWPKLLRDLPEPLLVIGNPPWVTNAELGSLDSLNLPKKTNFQKRSGLDAMTGKSNFDISEWMLIRVLEWLDGRNGTVAMLCKTAIARKVLLHAWKNRIGLRSSDIYLVDAAQYFGASVDACLLVLQTSPDAYSNDCAVYDDIRQPEAAHRIGYRGGQIVAEVALFERWRHLQGEEVYKWRSGVKHDCAKVMEFRKTGSLYRNGLNESVEMEDEYCFPMLKSSDLANGSTRDSRRWMLVTQKKVGDETTSIKHWAPKTWDYLLTHAPLLDSRASSVYKNRPRFSVFGVGHYSFAGWKVAISGFYKKLDFRIVGTIENKPVVLDDTSYFVGCQNGQEAEYVASLLNSSPAKEFYRAFIFWDAKRPITLEILRRLDLLALARELGTESTIANYVSQRTKVRGRSFLSTPAQGLLFPDATSHRG